MSPFFKKKPAALEARLQKIQEEMDQVNHDLRALTKFVEKPGRSVDPSRFKAAAMEKRGAAPPVAGQRSMGAPAGRLPAPQAPRPASTPLQPSAGPLPAAPLESEQKADARGPRGSAKAYDERFADYLASSFQASRPLREERRILRNKVIVMAVFVIALLILALYRFFKL